LIHPDSELRFVSPAIGYGLFATRPIPMGSVTWAADPLDQIIEPARLAELPAMLSRQVHRYSYLNGRGDRILCWDHGRFVNHSCAAACLSPGFDFEIAVRDIRPDEEITDDYGTLNPEAFCMPLRIKKLSRKRAAGRSGASRSRMGCPDRSCFPSDCEGRTTSLGSGFRKSRCRAGACR
jgi:SET domain-containing protein